MPMKCEVFQSSQVLSDPEESPGSLLSRFKRVLNSGSQWEGANIIEQFSIEIPKLVNALHSVSQFAHSDPENVPWQEMAYSVLHDTQNFIISQTQNEELMEVLASELPMVIAKYAGVSSACRELAQSIILHLSEKCNPRDLLPILCEALDSLIEADRFPAYFVPLLNGISKVFSRIERQIFEQVEATVPVILEAIKAASVETEDDPAAIDLIRATISVTFSIQASLLQKAKRKKEDLHALLGLLVLQIMALITSNRFMIKISSLNPFGVQLSHLLPFCGLSYIGLLTGSDIDRLAAVIYGGDYDNQMELLALARLGAAVSVSWGSTCAEVALAAGEDLESLISDIHSSQTKQWQAIETLRYIIISTDQLWDFKHSCIDLLLNFLDWKMSEELGGYSLSIPGILLLLKGIQSFIIYTMDTGLRKKAHTALKKVLACVPSSQRLGILKALVTSSNSSSMIALLLDFGKEEVDKEIKKLKYDANLNMHWSLDVLELIGLVLKPPQGGPPCLPEQSEAVLAALNLYRYLLIVESSGKVNLKGVWLADKLQKTYDEWLLPLRALLFTLEAENKDSCSEIALATLCALNPVLLVLYRCIELVEAGIKQSKSI